MLDKREQSKQQDVRPSRSINRKKSIKESSIAQGFYSILYQYRCERFVYIYVSVTRVRMTIIDELFKRLT